MCDFNERVTHEIGRIFSTHELRRELKVEQRSWGLLGLTSKTSSWLGLESRAKRNWAEEVGCWAVGNTWMMLAGC